MARDAFLGWSKVLVAAVVLAGASGVICAAEEKEEAERAWSNTTDLSVVITEGNSNARTLGFNNVYKRNWENARFQLKLDAVRSETADDRFVRLEEGITWLPGETPTVTTGVTVEPSVEPDVEKYFAEGRYDRQISEKFNWHVGTSWDRNEDAGILNRFIGFAGVGHIWFKEDGHEFQTSYGLSYTDREEDQPDPEKEDSFSGFRVSFDYLNQFGEATTYTSDFTGNLNLEDTADYSINWTNAVSVSLSKHLALKVSLQLLYEAEPALEEVDLVAFVTLIDPDGIPGNGDEFFQTVPSGGTEIVFGDTDIRKDELDSIFRTSLVINF